MTITASSKAVRCWADTPFSSEEGKTERTRFYRLVWGAQAGWVEVCAGLNGTELESRGWRRAGEPATGDYIGLLLWTRQTADADRYTGRPHTRQFFQWPAEADKLDTYAANLAQRFGNVYVGLSTYSSRDDAKRRQNPQPSQVVLVEDGPADPDLPYSFSVQTSPYSYHGYYLLDEPLASYQLVALATGAALRISGADPSGSDRQQLVRLPSSINSKEKAGRFRTRLTTHPRIYSLAELAASFLPSGDIPLPSSSLPALADPDAWQLVATLNQPENLRPGGPLLSKSGALHRLKVSHFVNRVLTGQSLWTERPEGRNATYSEWRFNLIKSLWLHGYPQAEIRLLAEHLAADDLDKRGSFQLRVDIDRIIEKLTTSHPRDENACTPSYRLKTGDVVVRKPTPRSRRGRPSTKEAQIEHLCAWLNEQTPNDWGLILFSVSAIASALKLGERSTQGYLRALREAGEIITGQIDGNGAHYIILTDRFRGAEKSVGGATEVELGLADAAVSDASDSISGGANQLSDQADTLTAATSRTFSPLLELVAEGAEKASSITAESSVIGGANEGAISVLEREEPQISTLMERTPRPNVPDGLSQEQGGVCAPAAEPTDSEVLPSSKRHPRQHQASVAFGTPPPQAKCQSPGLPRKTWATADVPSLEAELQRRRAMLRHIKRGPARRSVEHAIVELERLITSRRDLGLVHMLYANTSEPQPPGEPQAIRVGEAIAFAGGAAFIPPGSVGETALRALVNAAPAASSRLDDQLLTAISPPGSQAPGRGDAPALPITIKPLPNGWALERCDYRGNATRYGAYWRAFGPDGITTEPTMYLDTAQRDAWRSANASMAA